MHLLEPELRLKYIPLQCLVLLASWVLLPGGTGVAHGAEKYRIGHPITATQLAPWDINVFADGANLPSGSGTVAHGKSIYLQQCASCHGINGEGGTGDKLSGGIGTLASATPVKTVGSFWPYAPTLFDYIRRAMPLNAPQSLSNEQVYAVTSYVLHLNGLLPENATLDAKSLAAIRMPNRDGFVADPRPDVQQEHAKKSQPVAAPQSQPQ